MFSELTRDDVEKARELYKKQCPAFWDKGMGKDHSLMYVLAFGLRHDFDYLLHLADDYGRWKVEKLSKEEYNVRVYSRLWRDFVSENKLQNVQEVTEYLRHKRIIAMIDQRDWKSDKERRPNPQRAAVKDSADKPQDEQKDESG